MEIKSLSSIPGRIRLSVEGLKGNDKLALHIENVLKKLHNIQSINISIKTGNILIFYKYKYIDEAIILKSICKTPFNDLTIESFEEPRDSSIKLFKEEKNLSKRLLSFSVAVASISFFISSPISAISSLILGFPGIIYLSSYLSLRYTLSKATSNNVYIKDIKTIRLIKNVNSILIHSNVVLKDEMVDKLGTINYYKIESLLSNGAIEDPINMESRNLIKDLRYIGINDIYLIPNYNKNGVYLYANKSLGLDDLEKNKPPELIITNEEHLDSIKLTNNRVILSLSQFKEFNNESIQINHKELYKISWLIKNCIKSEEYLIRAQANAVAINIFGIMLTFIRRISILGSLFLYLANILVNTLYLNYKILHYDKELLNGKPTEFIIT